MINMTATNILKTGVVKNEIERIRKVERDFEERNVEYDISVLSETLNKINDVINDKKEVVELQPDMWDECHTSLDRIILHFGLECKDHGEFGKFSVGRKQLENEKDSLWI